jgi:uncharacterized protein (TIGR02246 family)
MASFGLCGAASAQMNPADSTAIMALVQRTAAAWNQNDLDGHVSDYADSAVFMAPGPVVGRDRIRASLERSFWRDGRPLQELRFEQVALKPLGTDHAIMTGRFILSGGGREERSGWYTLVWERQPEGWRIIHDHSS